MYVQDTWKALSNLTLSYGLGYQIDSPLHNLQYGGIGVTCFIPGQQSKIFSTAPKNLDYPGDPGCNNASGATTKYTGFGPRFGFRLCSATRLPLRGRFEEALYQRRLRYLLQPDRRGEFVAKPERSTLRPQYKRRGGQRGGNEPRLCQSIPGPHKAGAAGIYPNKFPFVPPAAGAAPNFAPLTPSA